MHGIASTLEISCSRLHQCHLWIVFSCDKVDSSFGTLGNRRCWVHFSHPDSSSLHPATNSAQETLFRTGAGKVKKQVKPKSRGQETLHDKLTNPPHTSQDLILPISIQVPPSIQWCSWAQSRAPSLLRLAFFNWGWVRSVQGGCSALRSKPGKSNQTWQSFAIKVWINQNAWPLQKLLLSEMKVAPVACFCFWKLRKVLERLTVYLCHVYVLVFTAEIKQRQWYKLRGPKCPASIGQPSSAHQTHQDRICYPKPNHIIVTGTWNHLKLDMCKKLAAVAKGEEDLVYANSFWEILD